MRGQAPPSGRHIFVDSSAFFALLNDRDQHHAEATRILKSLAREGAVLLTTNYIVAETHALTLVKLDYSAARSFLKSSEDSSLIVVRARVEDEEAARNIVYRYDDKSFSLTDAISFAVMDRLRIREAFSFDSDFRRYGLTSLGADR